MKKIIILGGGDLAEKTIEIINRDKLFKIEGYYNNQRSLKGIKFLGNFSKFAKQKNFTNNINYSLALGGRPELINLREKIIKIIKEKKLKTPKIISKKSSIHKRALIERGSIVFDNVLIDFDVKIDQFSIINIGSVVCHHSIIGENIILSPRSLICGRCNLEKNIFIGSGSIINPKVKIKKNIITGSMTNVLKDLYKSGTYVGNPSKRIR
tara:strand:+ start:2124 stop:2753 length:630 start_codon:yes stop_codon:yes gene_type:complete